MATKKKTTTTATKKKVAKKTPPPPPPQVAQDHIGKTITVKVGKAEYRGLCVSERETPTTKQVYLKLNGCVSRFFNTEDITEVK